MEKIRNTVIAPRTRRAAAQPPIQNPKRKRNAPKAKKAESKSLLLPLLTGLVAVLLAANVYFLLGDSKKATQGAKKPRLEGVQNAMLAALPGSSPSTVKQAESSAIASAIEYSTDIDDLSGYSLIVNKNRLLSPDYAPSDLDSPDVPFAKGKMQLRREAALAYVSMQRAALDDGVAFFFYSGYRDYAFQERIWKNVIKEYGQDWASAYSAPPGASEHQTGLAVDVSCAESGKQELGEKFAETPSGKWLAAHCAEYGFVLRYPKGKESTTGYSYEPWHFRYVGHALARAVSESGLVLEEFLGLSR